MRPRWVFAVVEQVDNLGLFILLCVQLLLRHFLRGLAIALARYDQTHFGKELSRLCKVSDHF